MDFYQKNITQANLGESTSQELLTPVDILESLIRQNDQMRLLIETFDLVIEL